MGLIPITYRWDKYVFRRDTSVEPVPRPGAVHRVEPGKKTLPDLEDRGRSPETPAPEDQYFSKAHPSKTWAQYYRERRTLWRPRQTPLVLQHPSEILRLISPETPPQEPPLLSALREHYGCHMTEKILAENQTRPVESSLRLSAKGQYDLLVLAREDLEWAGALLKEVAGPVLVLPAPPWKKEFPKKILVPVDGTPFSYPALSQAVILGEDFGAEIQIFEVGRGKDTHLGKLIERMAWKNLNHGFFQAKGGIPQAIADFAASEGAQMIVMGTHGVSPGSTRIPPSITLEVLHLSALPLWVVHPEPG